MIMMKVCDLERTQTGLEVTDESVWTKLKVLSYFCLGLQQTLSLSEGPVQSEFVHRGATESERSIEVKSHVAEFRRSHALHGELTPLQQPSCCSLA